VCAREVAPSPEGALVISLDEKTGIQAKAPVKADVGDAPDPTLWRLLGDRAALWMNYSAALAALAILALMVFKP
jgi:hypothetical protein